MISSRKRKWRYKAVSRPYKIKRLRKEDNDIRKFVAWCKEVGIRISKQVFERISVLQKNLSAISIAGITHKAGFMR